MLKKSSLGKAGAREQPECIYKYVRIANAHPTQHKVIFAIKPWGRHGFDGDSACMYGKPSWRHSLNDFKNVNANDNHAYAMAA